MDCPQRNEFGSHTICTADPQLICSQNIYSGWDMKFTVLKRWHWQSIMDIYSIHFRCVVWKDGYGKVAKVKVAMQSTAYMLYARAAGCRKSRTKIEHGHPPVSMLNWEAQESVPRAFIFDSFL